LALIRVSFPCRCVALSANVAGTYEWYAVRLAEAAIGET
jgi:hypothetical protein